MIRVEQFPRLEQFFGCYFHQDWREEYASEGLAIKDFVYNDGPEEARNTVEELNKLLSLHVAETELEKAMYAEFGCYFNPAHHGQSMTNWLRWVRDTLVKYAAEKAAQENPESSGKRG